MPDTFAVEGDVGNVVLDQLVDANGPVNLTGVTAVQLRVDVDGTVVGSTSTVTAPGQGRISTILTSGMVGTPGLHPYHYRVSWAAGVFQYFPSDRSKILEVLPHTRART